MQTWVRSPASQCDLEVPSPPGLRPSGLEDAPDALRSVGLHERLGAGDAVRVDVPPYEDARDPKTGILNPQGIVAVAHEVADAVDDALSNGRFPVLLGGTAASCSDRCSPCDVGAAMAWS